MKIPQRIASYLKGGRLHPAVIIAGETRDNRWALAKNIAKQFLCAKKGPIFCDECNHCRRIEKEIHPDVILYGMPEEDTIKIDEVRDLCHQMEIGPLEGNIKLCIIDECHRLNAASANALLKTLEEPGPGRFFWLLTSQPGALLPTVVSRCLKFHLPLDRKSEAPESDWSELFASFEKNHEAFRVTAKIDSKEKALDFVRFLQLKLHREALASPTATSALHVYDESVELEGRLRSNANYGLMLESFLSQHFK